MSYKENSGRSIFELIAVMAVIGLLSITVVKSYNKVVTKAKADAQKRQIATLAKEAQFKMLGNTSLTPVTVKVDDTEYTIGKGKKGSAKDYFGVKVKTTDKALCEELTDATFLSPALITVNGEKDGKCPSDIVFYFPKDPSNTALLETGDESIFSDDNSSGGGSGGSEGSGETTPTPSDYDGDADGCTGNNFTYCSNGSCVSTADDCLKPEDFENEEDCENARFNWCSGASTPTCQADCCAGFSENACQTACDTETGEITNKTNGTVCPGGVCEAGVCLTCAINPETDCLSKALVEGECACAPAACTTGTYCGSGATKECCATDEVCTTSGDVAGTCVAKGGNIACTTNASCNDSTKYCKLTGKYQNDCAEITGGTCETLDDGRETTYTDPTDSTKTKTFLVSSGYMSWWAADNWCKAHNKKLVSYNTVHNLFDCDKDNYSCTWSKFTTDSYWSNGTLPDYYWTAESYDSCNAWLVYVNDEDYFNTNYRSSDYSALCE